jgi:hypothetical protein
MPALYLLHAKSHIQFPSLTSIQRISSWQRLCEIFSSAVSSYGVELLAHRATTKLKDCPCRVSAAVYYQLLSSPGHSLLHLNLRTRHTVITWTHLVWLMINSHYHHHHLRQLIFSVTVTILPKVLFNQPDLKSVFNGLLSLYIIDPFLTFSLLLTPHWHSVHNSLHTDIQSIIHSILTFSPSFTTYWHSVHLSIHTDIQSVIHSILTISLSFTICWHSVHHSFHTDIQSIIDSSLTFSP